MLFIKFAIFRNAFHDIGRRAMRSDPEAYLNTLLSVLILVSVILAVVLP